MLRRTTSAGVLALAALILGSCGGTEADNPSDVGQPVRAESPAQAGPAAAPTDDGSAARTESDDEREAADEGEPEGAAADSEPLGAPTSLRFAGTTSPVVSVGSDAARNLEIPGDINTLGWWQDGAEPGAGEGFVVITGHATRTGEAVANTWWSAEPGDEIVVETDRGSLTYQVVSRKTYDREEVPLARWFPADGPAGPPALALITCADYRDGAWQANTVVEAVPA